MPEIIRKRKDKIGFSVPDLLWINENKDYFLSIFHNESFRSKRFVDNRKIVRNWEKILSGEIKVDLFRYICMELWMQMFSVS